MKRWQASLCVLPGLFAASVMAQQAPGMVNVDLGTVADALAKNIKVEVDKIPASLHVPVSVAAGACGVPATKLAPGAGGGMASCQAVSTSSELEDLVTMQMKAAPKQ
jgi:hypothetical protein